MNTMIKRTTTLVLAGLMILSAAVPAFAASITKAQAIKKALKNAHTTRKAVYNFEAERDGGRFEIEFTKKKNNNEYSYEYKASNGRLMEKSVDYSYTRNSSRKKIGKSAAISKVAKFSGIARSIVASGTCRYEYDDREGTYEVKFRKGNYKYDYDVLAPTGKVIEMSKDYRPTR